MYAEIGWMRSAQKGELFTKSGNLLIRIKSHILLLWMLQITQSFLMHKTFRSGAYCAHAISTYKTIIFTHNHYLRVHHKKLYVINDFKMLSCKCSEIRSHGYDRSAQNLHFHCYLCFHPFKMGGLISYAFDYSSHGNHLV